MAANADTVAVEVEARLQKFNSDTNAAAQNFDGAMDRIEKSAGQAEAAVVRSSKNIGVAHMDAATRTRQLGVQIGQLGSSMASGGNVMQAFAQQASDFAYVLGGTEGAAGRLATFFSGPWGAALLAAGLLVGTLASRHKEADGAAEGHRRSEKSLSDAIRELDKQTRDAIESQQERNRLTQVSIDQQIAAAQATRQHTAEILRQAIAQAEQNRDDPTFLNQMAGALGGQQVRSAIQGRLDQHVTELNNQLADAERNLDQLNRAAAQAKIPEMLQRASEATDAAAKATGEYERALDKLNQKFTAHVIGPKYYEQEAQRLMKVRDAAIEAARAADRLKKSGEGVEQVFAFRMPVQGPITSGFGARTPPTRGASSFHPAIDIGAPLGTPVHAAAPGVVVTAGKMGGLGNVVIVDHGGGTITEYGHLSSILATKGQEVTPDTIIGKVGSTGISTGPHLDYRVKVGGKYVDPRKGTFPIDQAGVASKVIEAGQAADDLAERQRDTFNNEMAQLQGRLIAALRPRVATMEEQLQIAEEDVLTERDNQIATVNAGVGQNRINAEQGKLLIAKINQVATAKTLALYDAEAIRKREVEAASEEARQASAIDQAQFEKEQARTANERRAASYRLLDAELELERMKQQQILDNTKIGSVEHERARLALADLERRRENGRRQIEDDPGNMGPGGQFLRSLPAFRESVEGGAVDVLRSFNDEIAKAVTGAEDLGDAFHNMSNVVINELARIAVQELIIKPVANLLFGGSTGAGGGGIGSLIGALGGLFGGGTTPGGASSLLNTMTFSYRASGGPVSAGQPYIVGEQGRELFVPKSDGAIVPNGQLGRSGTVEVHIFAGEEFATMIHRVTGPVIARASIGAAQGGSILARQRAFTDARNTLE